MSYAQRYLLRKETLHYYQLLLVCKIERTGVWNYLYANLMHKKLVLGDCQLLLSALDSWLTSTKKRVQQCSISDNIRRWSHNFACLRRLKTIVGNDKVWRTLVNTKVLIAAWMAPQTILVLTHLIPKRKMGVFFDAASAKANIQKMYDNQQQRRNLWWKLKGWWWKTNQAQNTSPNTVPIFWEVKTSRLINKN